PLDMSHWRGAEPTQANLRAITDEIMSAVRTQVAELRNEPAPDKFFVPARKYVDKSTKKRKIA
ncbi:MAG: 1-acyl-sn-glycerol-3-phosphate acyltransferase, partial [Jatrophihabitans sp.]